MRGGGRIDGRAEDKQARRRGTEGGLRALLPVDLNLDRSGRLDSSVKTAGTAERGGGSGGRFTLCELRVELLEQLDAFGLDLSGRPLLAVLIQCRVEEAAGDVLRNHLRDRKA